MKPADEKIANLAKTAEKSWGKSYDKFPKIINKNKLEIGAELGVAFGGHADAILTRTYTKLLYGVDPFLHIDSYNDPGNFPQTEFDAMHRFVNKRLAKHQKRYKSVRETSESGSQIVPDSLDYVYIDADHSYEGVSRDLSLWYPKIRTGGIIGGHDYRHPNHPGVKEAVDKFFSRLGQEIHEEGEGVWWVEKKAIPVSFVVPAYNAQDTILASLESIVDGNFKPGDELIVVDDCSTDNTLQILKKFKSKNDNKAIKILSHNLNKGDGAARNTGVEASSNELVFCLDSDNLLAKQSIPSLINRLVEESADFASFEELRYFKKSPKKIDLVWQFATDVNYDLAYHLSHYKTPSASGNYLFTKSAWAKFGRFPEFAGALNNWGFGLIQAAEGAKTVVLKDSFYFHRFGHESLWVRDEKKGQIPLLALKFLIPYIDLINEQDAKYILSKKGRAIWFDNLEKHPIRVKQHTNNRSFVNKFKRTQRNEKQ